MASSRKYGSVRSNEPARSPARMSRASSLVSPVSGSVQRSRIVANGSRPGPSAASLTA